MMTTRMPVILLSMIPFLLSGSTANASSNFPGIDNVDISFWYRLRFKDGMGYEDMDLCDSPRRFKARMHDHFEEVIANEMGYSFGFSPGNVNVKGYWRAHGSTTGFVYHHHTGCRHCHNRKLLRGGDGTTINKPTHEEEDTRINKSSTTEGEYDGENGATENWKTRGLANNDENEREVKDVLDPILTDFTNYFFKTYPMECGTDTVNPIEAVDIVEMHVSMS